jgi:hypothetical protein
MRKVDRLDEIGDAPLKEKKDEASLCNGFQRLFSEPVLLQCAQRVADCYISLIEAIVGVTDTAHLYVNTMRLIAAVQ